MSYDKAAEKLTNATPDSNPDLLKNLFQPGQTNLTSQEVTAEAAKGAIGPNGTLRFANIYQSTVSDYTPAPKSAPPARDRATAAVEAKAADPRWQTEREKNIKGSQEDEIRKTGGRVIAYGDTLEDIARSSLKVQHGDKPMSVKQVYDEQQRLMKLNKIADPNNIKAGTRIKIRDDEPKKDVPPKNGPDRTDKSPKPTDGGKPPIESKAQPASPGSKAADCEPKRGADGKPILPDFSKPVEPKSAQPGDTTAPKPGDTTAPKPGDTTAPKPGDTTAPKPPAQPGDTTLPPAEKNRDKPVVTEPQPVEQTPVKPNDTTVPQDEKTRDKPIVTEPEPVEQPPLKPNDTTVPQDEKTRDKPIVTEPEPIEPEVNTTPLEPSPDKEDNPTNARPSEQSPPKPGAPKVLEPKVLEPKVLEPKALEPKTQEPEPANPTEPKLDRSPVPSDKQTPGQDDVCPDKGTLEKIQRRLHDLDQREDELRRREEELKRLEDNFKRRQEVARRNPDAQPQTNY
jgi:hypothetical protein